MPSIFRDYTKDKADIKRFLTDFYTDLPDVGSQPGGKAFKYSKQLVTFNIAFHKQTTNDSNL